MLHTEEHDIVIGRPEGGVFVAEQTVVGDNDEITDLLVLDSHVVVSTNSSMVRVMDKKQLEKEGEYACAAEIVKGPNGECSLCLAGNRKAFFNGTKDGYINRYTLSSRGAALAGTAKNSSPVTALHLEKHVLLAGFGDGVVKGWEVKEQLEHVFTSAVSSTEITGLVVLGRTILAASKDKEVKRLDFTGRVLGGLEGHRKGIWSVHAAQDTLVTGSADKTARVWRDGAVQHTLQHNLSVVKALAAERVVTATSEGIVRIWNPQKEKELAAKKLADTKEDKIWSMKEIKPSIYAVSAGGTLFVLQDNTRAIEHQKEEQRRSSYLIKEKGNALMKRQQYSEAAAEYFKLDSQREVREALRRMDASVPIAPLFSELSKNQERALACLCKWTRSPQLMQVSARLLAEIIRARWSVPRARTEELASTLLRSSDLLNDAY